MKLSYMFQVRKALFIDFLDFNYSPYIAQPEAKITKGNRKGQIKSYILRGTCE